jgi:RHS repeat-associated protein
VTKRSRGGCLPRLRSQYAAGQLDTTGLYHFGERYYDPNTMRWTQQDPINQGASLTQANRYAYAGGDPINNVDPIGMATASGHCIEGRKGFMRCRWRLRRLCHRS